MIKALFKHIYKYYKDTFILAIAGVVIGVLVGIIDAAFGLGLNACTAIRTKYFWYLIWFLPLGGVFIWFIYHQFGKSVANGMKMVFHVGLGKNTKLPIRMVPLAVIGTWTTHLFGGSAGREGVAVQIGAFTSMGFEKKFHKVFPIVLDILSELGALKDNACPQTGIEFDDYARLVDISQYQIKVKLSLDGIKSINENIDKSNENYNNQPNNYLRGFCGLLIGGIVGAVVAFILDLLGVISTVSPAIAIILGVYLYKKFGGKPNVVMILMSIFVTIVCIFLPSFIGYISLANELCSKGETILSGFEAFSYCLSTNSEFSRMFKAELLYNIVFTLLAVVWCAIPLFKSLKRPTNLK